MKTTPWFPLFVALLLGCQTTSVGPEAPDYSPKTTLELAAARCQGGSCPCRSLTEDAEKEQGIQPGLKRFEFRLPRTTSRIWIAVGDRGHYFKPAERVTPQCFYLDLPGKQTVRLMVHSELADEQLGLQTGLKVYQYAARKEGPSWYKVLDFSCGGMNKCTQAGIEAWVDFARKLPKGVYNSCGSVKIKGLAYSGDRERRIHADYRDLTLQLSLKIYGFEPHKNPFSPECLKDQ